MDKQLKHEPVLKLNILSHGTVEVMNLQRARTFYEEVLGLEVVQTSAVSLMLRLNTTTTIAAVENKGGTSAGVFNHFGFDVASKDLVDECYERVKPVKDKYGIKKITRPIQQHGTYSFYIVDEDENWWEILENPDNGYSYVFELEQNTARWNDQDQGSQRRANYETNKN